MFTEATTSVLESLLPDEDSHLTDTALAPTLHQDLTEREHASALANTPGDIQAPRVTVAVVDAAVNLFAMLFIRADDKLQRKGAASLRAAWVRFLSSRVHL